MFSTDFIDFQDYIWSAYGDIVTLLLFTLIVVMVIVLFVTFVDRVFLLLLNRKGGDR